MGIKGLQSQNWPHVRKLHSPHNLLFVCRELNRMNKWKIVFVQHVGLPIWKCMRSTEWLDKRHIWRINRGHWGGIINISYTVSQNCCFWSHWIWIYIYYTATLIRSEIPYCIYIDTFSSYWCLVCFFLMLIHYLRKRVLWINERH